MVTKSKHIITAEDKTKAALKSADSNFRNLLTTTTRLVPALTALTGVVGFAGLTRSQLQYLDVAGKTADKLSLTTEALTSLQFAVSQTSQMTEQGFNTALQRMSRRLGDTTSESGPLKDVMQELGLDLEKIKDLSVDQSFLVLADAISATEDEQRQLSIAMKLFDTEGVELINTLRKGSDGIRELQREAENLGLTFSREEASKAEKYNDAMDKLSRSFNSLFSEVAIVLSGPLANFAGWLTDNIQAVRSFTTELAAMFGVIEAMDENQLRKRLSEVNDEIERMDVDSKSRGLAMRRQRLMELKEEAIALEKVLENINNPSANVIEINSGNNEAFNPYQFEGQDADGPYNAFLEKSEEAAKEFERIWGSTLNTFSSGVGNAVADAIIDQEDLSDALQETMRNTAKSVIATLVQITTKKLALMALEKLGIISTMTSTKIMAGTLGAAWAPAATMASLATLGGNAIPAQVGMATTFALGQALAGIQGQAHDGLDFVPKTGTFILEKGEGVIDKKTNQNLREGKLNGGMTVIFQLNAIDARSGVDYLMENSGTVVDIVQRAYEENGNNGGPLR